MPRMAKDGFAAVELGRLIGASAQEFNRLLADQGFQERVNGAWALTEKGRELATRVLQTSSSLPQAKSWDATYWPERLLEVIDTSAEALAKVRTGLALERAAQGAALRADQAAADALFIAAQTTETVQALARRVDGKTVGYAVVGAVALTAVGFAIALPIRRARATRERTDDGTRPPEAPAVDEP
jgi:hypothetical protein